MAISSQAHGCLSIGTWLSLHRHMAVFSRHMAVFLQAHGCLFTGAWLSFHRHMAVFSQAHGCLFTGVCPFRHRRMAIVSRAHAGVAPPPSQRHMRGGICRLGRRESHAGEWHEERRGREEERGTWHGESGGGTFGLEGRRAQFELRAKCGGHRNEPRVEKCSFEWASMPIRWDQRGGERGLGARGIADEKCGAVVGNGVPGRCQLTDAARHRCATGTLRRNPRPAGQGKPVRPNRKLDRFSAWLRLDRRAPHCGCGSRGDLSYVAA
eukprot:scaffold8292_cov120-Isochrysis_galbana.AAC.2